MMLLLTHFGTQVLDDPNLYVGTQGTASVACNSSRFGTQALHDSDQFYVGTQGTASVARNSSRLGTQALHDQSFLCGYPGYCQRGTQLFPTWAHRAYMILIISVWVPRIMPAWHTTLPDLVHRSYMLLTIFFGYSGYCQHGTQLFPTWHRPYMLLNIFLWVPKILPAWHATLPDLAPALHGPNHFCVGTQGTASMARNSSQLGTGPTCSLLKT
jgi:Common central domain of tyrosinase